MKCLVFSDSHGYVGAMEEALNVHTDAEVIFFLGDGLSDLEYIKSEYPERTYYAVRGNCDFSDRVTPATAEALICGKRIMLTHGHEYGVKHGFDTLMRAGEQRLADIVLFGHTHDPYECYIDNGERAGGRLYLFNPGSISYTYGSENYGIITLERGKEPLFSHKKQ